MPLTRPRRRDLTVLLILQLIHFSWISAQIPLRGQTSLLESIVFKVISPFRAVVSGAINGVSSFYHGYIGLRGANIENEALRRELENARLELNRVRGERGELDRLREVLQLADALPYRAQAALVVGADALNPVRSLFINKGTDDGVRQNCPVITPEGFLVGRVITPLAGHQATVQVLTDTDANVGVILANSRRFGVLSGAAGESCTLKYIPNSVETQPGEDVLTSGLDQVYPRGLPVGRIASSTPGHSVFKEILVTPLVTLNRLEHVLVLIGDKAEQQQQ